MLGFAEGSGIFYIVSSYISEVIKYNLIVSLFRFFCLIALWFISQNL